MTLAASKQRILTAGSSSKPAPPPAAGPFDAYVSPEMSSYTKVLRFGHQLLIPTKIGDAPSKLFMIDTGGFANMIDPAAAREVTKVHGDPNMRVKGVSGSVKNVYSADKAVLIFGNLRQENQDIVSFDMTSDQRRSRDRDLRCAWVSPRYTCWTSRSIIAMAW